MKEDLICIGIGLLCLAGVTVFLAGMYGLVMLIPRYPYTLGVICAIGLSWVIGMYWRM